MLNSCVVEGIAIGTAVALVTAAINQLVTSNINPWLLLVAVALALLLYATYQGFGAFPFVTYVVTNHEDGRGLLTHTDVNPRRPVGGNWQFTATHEDHAVFGPYLRHPLRTSKYRVVFQLKVAEIPGSDRPIMSIDVVSNV